jgi:phosphoglycolate phosphatase-like HAD superfamily hydrolase
VTIRAVFFDLDDTLCDTIGTREARARVAFESLAAERPELDGAAFGDGANGRPRRARRP